jgi:glutamine amidotransferase
MIAIVDYGVGNLFSLKSSFSAIGVEAVVTNDPMVLCGADKIILPGVGAFEDAARKLRESGLDVVIKNLVAAGKPLMGICLGMQMLFEKSYEYGEHEGLGLIPGVVKPIADVIPADLKIPHIGWNALRFKETTPCSRKSVRGTVSILSILSTPPTVRKASSPRRNTALN